MHATLKRRSVAKLVLKARRHKGQSQQLVNGPSPRTKLCSKPEGIRGSLRFTDFMDQFVPVECSKPEGIRGSLSSESTAGLRLCACAQSPKA